MQALQTVTVTLSDRQLDDQSSAMIFDIVVTLQDRGMEENIHQHSSLAAQRDVYW